MKKTSEKRATAVGSFIKGVYESCGASVELIGSNRIIIEDVVSILEYEPNCVKVIADGKNVTVHGYELILKSFNSKTVIVCGSITDVSLEHGVKK